MPNLNQLKGVAEKQKIENVNTKKDYEQQIKIVNLLLDNNEKNMRVDLEKKNNQLLEKMNFELADVRNRLTEIKLENGKYHVETMNMTKTLRQDCENLKYYKIELDVKTGELVKMNEKTNKNFVKLHEEFDLFKLKFNELSEFIKVRE